MLSMVLIPSVALGADTRTSLETIKEELTPFVTDCYNISASYADDDTVMIKQLCPYGTETMYGEMKKTLIINLQELNFERVPGWKLI